MCCSRNTAAKDAAVKFMFVSIIFPMYEIWVYMTTGNIVALSTSLVLFVLWLILFILFLQAYDGPEDKWSKKDEHCTNTECP